MSPINERTRKRSLGQFFTSSPIADYMASLFSDRYLEIVRLLDAGAGSGALSSAFVKEMCQRDKKPLRIEITAFERDETVIPELHDTLEECRQLCDAEGIVFEYDLRNEDFITFATEEIKGGLFAGNRLRFNAAIVNPPYRKIRSDSVERRLLKSIGIETSNLYTAFIALITRLLESDSELVAITPRSFCNGPYFKAFRRELLTTVTFRQIHVFESRTSAFRHDDVLQENVIFHVVKGHPTHEPVILSSSANASPHECARTVVLYSNVVSPDDPNQFIHLTLTEHDADARSVLNQLTSALDDLGLSVSTGRVVDFRAKEYLRAEPECDTVPLIYPCHFDDGRVTWPRSNSRKPNAIVNCAATRDLLIPNDYYVLTKRFSPKEERRRIVACIFDPATVTVEFLGFDNKLNYFHSNGRGISASIAKGLFAFLNSSIVDVYFRQFNGHTQVNATDLRSLRYPSKSQLEHMGEQFNCFDLFQEEIDWIVEETLRGQK